MEIALLIVAVIVAIVLFGISPLARSNRKAMDDDHHTTAVRAHADKQFKRPPDEGGHGAGRELERHVPQRVHGGRPAAVPAVNAPHPDQGPAAHPAPPPSGRIAT